MSCFHVSRGLRPHREKARIPAWCDRVLWKGSNLRQLHYSSANLRFSDHRPVWAIFTCMISVVDEKQKAHLQHTLYRKYRHSTRAVVASEPEKADANTGKLYHPGIFSRTQESAIGAAYDKWWLNHGQSQCYSLIYESPRDKSNSICYTHTSYSMN